MENTFDDKTELQREDVPTISSDEEEQIRRGQETDVDETDEDERGNKIGIGTGEDG